MLQRFLTFFLFGFFGLTALANSLVVNVGLISQEPPVSFFEENRPTGIAFDLLNKIATQQNITLKVFPENSEKQGYLDLRHKKIDLLAGAITPTSLHKHEFHYSLPFMLDTVSVATRHSLVSLSRLIDEMGRTLFWDILLVALLGQLSFSFVLWLTERRHHEEFLSRNMLKGFGYANWAIVSAFLRDLIYEPKTARGRYVMGSWLVCSVVFMTVLASSVTVSIVNIGSVYHNPIKQVSDLRQMKVGVFSHEALAETIKSLGVRAVQEDSESALLNNLHNKKYDAVIDNAVMLDYFLTRHPDLDISVTGLTLRANYFSYVVRKNSPLLSIINQDLVELQSTNFSNEVCRRYLNNHIHECAL